MVDATESDFLQPSHYVGIGASAGGLEAIDQFFKNMPPVSGCAFVVVQHLSPDHKSLMAELLSKRTEMILRRAEDGMQVEADHVYLIPPNNDLRIFHGKLVLTEQDRHGGLNLPIDIFLNSLAEDQGEKAVGIILSGTGSDGTRGIRAIKEKVGMVMVQKEETAGFDGMPRSAIATGVVDYILSPDEMPEQLISYIKHPYANKQQSGNLILSDDENLNRIFTLLREKTGIDFSFYKPNTVVRRIERRMTVNQVMSIRDYVRYLEGFPKEIGHLHRDLLIGVTAFFRDKEAYDELRQNWLPELIQENQGQQLRLWVAGCSTGEEAYSIAILCQEIMSDLGVLVDIKIFATDVDKEAIAIAGAGLYPESISADTSPELLSKYFYRREDGYQIARHIREMVVFAQHNVIKDPPFTNIEFISCRNLLIYLQSVLQQRVMELFNFSLNQRGLLFLGTSETTGDMHSFFEPLHNKWKIYRSKGKKRRDGLSDQASHFSNIHMLSRPVNERTTRGFTSNFHEEERLIERLINGISGMYLPFTMVLSENMELLHVVGEAKNFLQFPTGRMLNDVTKLAHRDLAIPLATGVQKVLKEESNISYSNIHIRDDEEQNNVVNMHIVPLPTRKGQDPLVAAFVEELPSEPETSNRVVSSNYDIGREAKQRIIDLEQELQFTRENLQATVEELETSNEELQATNEELLASNEELQSTNEELQSVNEELYTVNAEYQSKISELTEANNDLDNLFGNTHLATLFLDENLEIRRFTNEITNLIRIMEQDIGRPFDHFAHSLVDVDLDRLIREVNQKHTAIEMEIENREGQSFLMRAFPYRIGPNMYAGVLLIFINIDLTKQMQRALEQSEERNLLAQQSAHFGTWDWQMSSNKLTWSPTIEKLFGIKKGKFDGTYEAFLNSIPAEDRVRVKEQVQLSLDDPNRMYSVEHRIIREDNDEVRWMLESGKVHCDDSGKPYRMVGMVKDITDKKLAELSNISTSKMFTAALENLKMLTVQIDAEGRVLFLNHFFCEYTGWEEKEVIGKIWTEHFIPEQRCNEIQNVFSNFINGVGEIPHHYRNPILGKDGQLLEIFWNNSPILNAEGVTIGVVAIGLPIDKLNEIKWI